jgi:hypothetical protein
MIRRLFHLLAHLGGWNLGVPEVWTSGGRLLIGFRCTGCGKLQDVAELSRRPE